MTILNDTPFPDLMQATRDRAQLHSFASTHAILSLMQGQFVSAIDPPQRLQNFADACKNQGLWPVLVGDAGQRNNMLAAPIILYDYPQIAAESPGDLFDATEIDEILTLRVLTLTDDEKSEMAAVEQAARRLLQRTDSLDGETLARMHGRLRRVQIATEASAEGALP